MIAAITLILRQGAFGAPSATGLLDIAIKVGVDLRGPAGDHCREDDRLAAGLARCHLPSGLVRCHDCDQLLEVESAKSNSVFYYRHPAGLKTPHCQRARWRAEVVEEAVIGRLHKLANDDGLFERVQRKADEALKQEEPELLKELKHAKARLDRLESERTNLVRVLTQSESEVPASFWAEAGKKDKEVQQARGQLRAKESELAAVQGRSEDSNVLRGSLQNIDQLFHELPADEKRRFLHAVVDSLAVRGDNSITLFLVHEAESWNKALGVKRPWAKYPGTTSWLPWRTDTRTIILRILGLKIGNLKVHS